MTNTQDATDLDMVRAQARKVIHELAAPQRLKTLLDAPGSFDLPAWRTAVELGWPLLYAPEALGGLGCGLAGLAVLAQELGRATISLPLVPAFVLLEAVAANAALKTPTLEALAKQVASGQRMACLALAEPGESGLPAAPSVRLIDSRVTGVKALAPFAAVADVALISALEGERAIDVLVELNQPGVTRKVRPSVDQARGAAELHLEHATCIRLGGQQPSASAARAALGVAFEQIGGAEASMLLARDYALERRAFGQPIGRFQAVKHAIAEMYAKLELARGCALDALDAYETSVPSWPSFSAAARIAAIEAYEYAASETIQIHGGLGTSWEATPQHHYRRSRTHALELGSLPAWRDTLLIQAGVDEPSAATEAASRDVRDVSDELHAYRLEARHWLAEHAPGFCGAARRGLGFEQDVALARRWQAQKAAAGYAAINLPRESGGGGKTELHKIVFGEEELRYGLPTEYFVISTAQVMAIFLRYGAPEVSKRLAPAAIRGEQIWCQMFSEPAAGSDLAAVRLKATRETRDGVAGWRLDGQKLWTSWAHIADWGVVVTRSDPSQPKHVGITLFYVDMHTPGISVRPIRRMAGHADLNEVFFEDVFVPDSQRLGAEGAGFAVALEMLMIERVAGVYDESVGGVSLDRIIELARSSRIAGRSALQDGYVRMRLADAWVQRQGLRSLYRRAMAAVEQGREPGPEGALRKLVMGRARQRLSAMALDLLGAQGVAMDPHGDFRTDVSWSWIDPGARIAGGTDEVLLSTLAERVLGLPQDHRPDKNMPFNQAV